MMNEANQANETNWKHGAESGRAYNALKESAIEQGWSDEYFGAQILLVIKSFPHLPGAEMHDSTCEFASAFIRDERARRSADQREREERIRQDREARRAKSAGHYGADYIISAAKGAQRRGGSRSEMNYALGWLDR